MRQYTNVELETLLKTAALRLPTPSCDEAAAKGCAEEVLCLFEELRLERLLWEGVRCLPPTDGMKAAAHRAVREVLNNLWDERAEAEENAVLISRY